MSGGPPRRGVGTASGYVAARVRYRPPVSPVTDPLGSAQTGGSPQPPARSRWGRTALITVLIVIATAIIPVAVTAQWVQRTVVNQEQFLATVGPLAESKPIQDAIADAAVNSLNANGGVETRVDDLLPQALQPLAPAIAGGLNAFLREAITQFLRTPVFEKLWTEIVLTIHSGLIAVLEGRDGGAVGLTNGEVTLDVNTILDEISKDLASRGLTVFDQVKFTADVPPIVLLRSDQLAFVQQVYALVQPLILALLPIAILLYAGAILLARRRPVVTAVVAVAYAVGAGLMWAGLHFFEVQYRTTLGGGLYGDALVAFAEQILTFLYQAVDNNLVYALALLLVAIMAFDGPMGSVRRGVEQSLRGLRRNPQAAAAAVSYQRWIHRLTGGLVIAGSVISLLNNLAWQWTVLSLVVGMAIVALVNVRIGSLAPGVVSSPPPQGAATPAPPPYPVS